MCKSFFVGKEHKSIGEHMMLKDQRLSYTFMAFMLLKYIEEFYRQGRKNAKPHILTVCKLVGCILWFCPLCMSELFSSGMEDSCCNAHHLPGIQSPLRSHTLDILQEVCKKATSCLTIAMVICNFLNICCLLWNRFCQFLNLTTRMYLVKYVLFNKIAISTFIMTTTLSAN